jgi:hypothetical protein
MGVITYTAVDRGELAATHADGTLYTIEIPLADWDRQHKRVATTQKSLAGTRHTVLQRIERFYNFATIATDDATLVAHLTEFFSSVSGGENFDIDPFGTIAAPSASYTCVMDGDYKADLVNQTEYKFSARVEVV